MDLLQCFIENIRTHALFAKKDRLLLAVSGGVDSVVLCELCKQAGYDFAIAHCNFQLRGEDSDRDAKFVKSLAAKYGAAFYINTFDTRSIAGKRKKSIEETARELRYEWFRQLVDEQQLDYIVTAHHADDNIETVAMNFFRGTGIKGLRGMLPRNGKIVRPLLFAGKKQLEDFAAAHHLEFVTDATNTEDEYTRNFFRNRVIPMIKSVYPAAEQNLLHNLDRFSDTEELYRQAIAFHKKNLLEQKGNEFHIPVLKLKKSTPLRSIIYEILREFGFSAPQAEEVKDLLDSETGKYIASSTYRVIRNRKWLIITPLAEAASANIFIEKERETVQFANGFLKISRMHVADCKLPADHLTACLDLKEISFPLLLRKWKPGDYFYPLGMKKKKKLSRFFIDSKLSRSDKEKVWVIESDKRIIWIIGHRIDDRFKITGNTQQVLHLDLHA